MRVSELIELLKKQIKQSGDVSIGVHADGKEYYWVTGVRESKAGVIDIIAGVSDE